MRARTLQCPGLVDSCGIDRLHRSQGCRSVGPKTGDPESAILDLVSGSRSDLCEILDWANHGICGRGVLLDMVRYWEMKRTPVDPWTSHAITPRELEECARFQGITFRKGDILLLRVGFIRKYCGSTREERDGMANLGVDLSRLCVSFRPSLHFRSASDTTPAARVLSPQMT
jgi:hypothetical protein